MERSYMMAQTAERKRVYDHEYYLAHRDEIIAREKSRKDYQHEYYENNKPEILTRQGVTAKAYRQTEQGKEKQLANTHRMMARHPDKYKARYIVRNAVRLGQLTKEPCEICGSTEVESHHDDYSKPLEVRWFCHQHHCELEGRWTRNN